MRGGSGPGQGRNRQEGQQRDWGGPRRGPLLGYSDVQTIYIGIAVVLILAGLVLTLSPLPFGAFIVVGGLSMLLAVSPRARAYLRLERRLHPKIDAFLARAEDETPDALSGPLRRTDGEAARHVHEIHDLKKKRAARVKALKKKRRAEEAG